MFTRQLFSFVILATIAAPTFADEPAKLLPRPAGEAMEKADKAVRDIFASDIDAAKKPSEKAKLARHMLKIAADTNNDDAGRFALCDLARSLAVAGRDKTAAFAASASIAGRYQPDGPTDGKEQFEKAQEIWREAEKARGDEKLKLQADAAEWYAYAKPAAEGINKLLIEKRLENGEATTEGPEEKSAAMKPNSVAATDASTASVALNGVAKPIRGNWIIDKSVLTSSPDAWSEVVIQLPRSSKLSNDGFEIAFSVILSNADWGSCLHIETEDGKEAGFDFANQKGGAKPMDDFLAGRISNEACFLTPQKKYNFRCRVCKGRLTTFVNDKLYCSVPFVESKENKTGARPLIRLNCSWQLVLIQDFTIKGLKRGRK